MTEKIHVQIPESSGDILWFKEISKDDTAKVGGKGANLGEMFKAGMPIPPGFCVTAQAYERFLEQAGIKEEIARILQIDVEDNEALHKASKEIQEIIARQSMPEDTRKAITEAYSGLGKGDEFVAVRSSATAEDLPEASFAGQQATFLNVREADKVVRAVQECWASLFTARAIYYRTSKNFNHMDVLISVVVQKMVDSKKAGVMFTVNPATNDDGQIIIEGAFGLGEMVVSGRTSPDLYIIDKLSGNIKDIHVNEQKSALFRNEAGENYTHELDPQKANSQVLSDDEMTRIAELGRKIEKHYGFPQDIEWAVDGKIFVTQSRPVTTFKKG
ncbi:hypothetical protein GF351_06350 [Candidatus Woesearchaeota archaeon]|nr:hypothetical protein [Candidatus Woesearchaeota archaeon]